MENCFSIKWVESVEKVDSKNVFCKKTQIGQFSTMHCTIKYYDIYVENLFKHHITGSLRLKKVLVTFSTEYTHFMGKLIAVHGKIKSLRISRKKFFFAQKFLFAPKIRKKLSCFWKKKPKNGHWFHFSCSDRRVRSNLRAFLFFFTFFH